MQLAGFQMPGGAANALGAAGIRLANSMGQVGGNGSGCVLLVSNLNEEVCTARPTGRRGSG